MHTLEKMDNLGVRIQSIYQADKNLQKLHVMHATDNPSDDEEFPVCLMETIGNMSKRDSTDPIIGSNTHSRWTATAHGTRHQFR